MDNIVNTEDIVIAQEQIQVEPAGPITGPIQKQDINQPALATQGKLVMAEQKKKASFWHRIASLKNSPWLLLLGPIVLVAATGGIWLGNNFGIITNNLNQPYTMLAGPAIIVTIVAIWFLFNFFKAIVAAIKSIWMKIGAYDNKELAILWGGTVAFLCVSVTEGSTTFNEIFTDNLHGVLGYAAAIVIDVFSIIFIMARQRAVRRNNDKGQRLFMFAVCLCAAASTIANGYSTQEHYVAPHNIAGTLWVLGAYALGTLPPFLIVFLGIATDFINDQSSSDIDPDAFQEEENNRNRFEEIQLEGMRKRIQHEQERDNLNGRINKKANKIALKQAKAQAKIEKIKNKAAGRLVPLITLSLRKPEPINYARLVEELVPAIVEKVKIEPVNYERIRGTIVSDLSSLMPASVPVVEPLNVDDLLQKLTPMVAQSIPPVPAVAVDYERLEKTMRATIAQEVKALASQVPAPNSADIPQNDVAKKAKMSHTRTPREIPPEERLETALQGFLGQAKEVSGRALADVTGINKNKATAWLKEKHPEYVKTKTGGTSQQLDTAIIVDTNEGSATDNLETDDLDPYREIVSDRATDEVDSDEFAVTTSGTDSNEEDGISTGTVPTESDDENADIESEPVVNATLQDLEEMVIA
jgi:hypothetical protein